MWAKFVRWHVAPVSGELARTKLAVSLAAPLKLDKLLCGIGSA